MLRKAVARFLEEMGSQEIPYEAVLREVANQVTHWLLEEMPENTRLINLGMEVERLLKAGKLNKAVLKRYSSH